MRCLVSFTSAPAFFVRNTMTPTIILVIIAIATTFGHAHATTKRSIRQGNREVISSLPTTTKTKRNLRVPKQDWIKNPFQRALRTLRQLLRQTAVLKNVATTPTVAIQLQQQSM